MLPLAESALCLPVDRLCVAFPAQYVVEVDSKVFLYPSTTSNLLSKNANDVYSGLSSAKIHNHRLGVGHIVEQVVVPTPHRYTS